MHGIFPLSKIKEEFIMHNLINKAMKKLTEKEIEKSANTFCIFCFHQPKAPSDLKKYSRIK